MINGDQVETSEDEKRQTVGRRKSLQEWMSPEVTERRGLDLST